jgi:aspartate racemase
MIGIVGGVGPYAGLDLLQNVFSQTAADKDQDHLDAVMFNLSSGILDRTEYLLGQIDINPGYAIAEVLLKLEKAGAQVAGIPCNTAHAEEIMAVVTSQLASAGSTIQLLSLIKEAVFDIKSSYPDVIKVGVLSTTGTNKFGIYQQVLQAEGLQPVIIPLDMQESLIHPAIYDLNYGIKARSNPVSEQARQDLLKGIDYLSNQGAQVVIKGCTEIVLAVPEQKINGLPLIDPSIALARALIKAEDPEKLKPLEE